MIVLIALQPKASGAPKTGDMMMGRPVAKFYEAVLSLVSGEAEWLVADAMCEAAVTSAALRCVQCCSAALAMVHVC